MAHGLGEKYEPERKRIAEIGRINGYATATVEHIVKKHDLKQQRIESSILFSTVKKDEPKRIVLPYLHHKTHQLSTYVP